MLIVGLTGGIGSGKSTVADLFAKKNITIIDTDQLARDVTQPNKPALDQIVAKFGPDILLANGTLNRTLLRKRVFTDAHARRWLEELLHPLIFAEMQNQVELASSPYCIIVIPLLFETEATHFVQRVLVVDADEEQQRTRTALRDNMSLDEVSAIQKTQFSREKRLRLADDIIRNDGTLEDLVSQVDELHVYYLYLAQT